MSYLYRIWSVWKYSLSNRTPLASRYVDTHTTPSHHSPTHTHDHGAGENSVHQWASTSVKKLLVCPVHMCARGDDRQSYLIERDRHGSLPNISTAGTTLASGADKRWPMKKVQMSPQSSLHTVVQLSERFYPNTIVKAVLVPSQTIVTNRLD